MGLTITTDDKGIKVIRQDKTSKSGNPYQRYSLMVSSKDVNGEWHNGFMECSFKKGVSVTNKAKIKINNAFPVVDEYNGNTRVSLKILDFEVLDEGVSSPTVSDDGFMKIPDGIEEEMEYVFQ